MRQLGFFEGRPRVVVDDAGGSILYIPNALDLDAASGLYTVLERSISWRAERRMMYEREVAVPRLVASFRYETGLPAELERIVPTVERLAGSRFNSVGLNLYRSGADSVAPHNDTLVELEPAHPIALLSLGGTRRMTIRSKSRPRRSLDLDLESGSLLVMSYETQRTYDHAIPKTNARVEPRISAAFRMRLNVATQFVSHVLPPSAENACSK